MSLEYKQLLGLPFTHGSRDCYELARDFYKLNWGIELTPYARPEEWWEHGMNLYMDHFYDEGFRVIDVHPRDLQIGDGFLMAVLSDVANHCAMLVEPGVILHHRYGLLSNVEPYDSHWRKRTVAVLRHPKVSLNPQPIEVLDLQSILPPAMKSLLELKDD